MNINRDDVYEFLLKFKPKSIDTTGLTLKFDMMVCKVEKDSSSDRYWSTSVEDYNVRVLDASTTDYLDPELDSNGLLASGGQDWIIPDNDYSMKRHLCTANTDLTLVA